MNKLGRLSAILWTAAFFIGFWQGLSIARYNPFLVEPSPETIDAQIRVNHAKELFGSTYKNSIVRRAELVTGVEDFIHARVAEGLPTSWQASKEAIVKTIISEANTNGLDPIFVLAVITRESRMKPEVRGRHGEIGLMQLKPDTAAWIARKSNLKFEGEATLLDPCQNIRLGVAYIKMLRTRYDKHSLFYISAYNMGPKKLQQLVNQEVAPKEYAGKVMQIYAGFYKELLRAHMQRTQGVAQYRLVASL